MSGLKSRNFGFFIKGSAHMDPKNGHTFFLCRLQEPWQFDLSYEIGCEEIGADQQNGYPR